MEGLASIAMATSADLRRANLRVTMSDAPRSLRAQIRAADKVGATRVVIIGPDEVAKHVATVRELGSGEQREVELDRLAEELSP
jgi:histidyl-tRNA synthetase